MSNYVICHYVMSIYPLHIDGKKCPPLKLFFSSLPRLENPCYAANLYQFSSSICNDCSLMIYRNYVSLLFTEMFVGLLKYT